MSNTQNKDYLGIILAILIITAFGTRFADYVWARNTTIQVYAPCDTTNESCFISDEENAWLIFQLEPYKKIEIIEKNAPFCLEEHTCEEFTCDGVIDCHETQCDESTLEEGEFCYDDFIEVPHDEDLI